MIVKFCPWYTNNSVINARRWNGPERQISTGHGGILYMNTASQALIIPHFSCNRLGHPHSCVSLSLSLSHQIFPVPQRRELEGSERAPV